MPFKPASRITQADIDNNRRSMDRRLADSLILIVKRNRSDFSWQLPQSKMLPRETLRASAERVVKRAGGPKVCTWFVGNAPIGHYKYEYSEALQKKRKVFGAHVFFLRMQLLKKDSVVVPKKYFSDYAWIARYEKSTKHSSLFKPCLPVSLLQSSTEMRCTSTSTQKLPDTWNIFSLTKAYPMEQVNLI